MDPLFDLADRGRRRRLHGGVTFVDRFGLELTTSPGRNQKPTPKPKEKQKPIKQLVAKILGGAWAQEPQAAPPELKTMRKNKAKAIANASANANAKLN